MSRRSLTLLLASAGTIAAIAVGVFVPVPYVILGPGPTLNTLGEQGGKPLISIAGHATYPTSGHLNMVTVSYEGGPGDNLNIFTALAAWLNPHEAVVPSSELFPPGQTAQQSQQQDTVEMTDSQQTATAAALTQLHIPFTTQTVVVQAEQGYPAYGVLKSGDVITAVDGKPVTSATGLQQLIYAHPAGSTLTVKIIRNGQAKQVMVGTKEVSGHPVMGVEITGQYKFPFTVNISVGDIGGPSAGHDVRARHHRQADRAEPDRRPVHRGHRGDHPRRPGGGHRRDPAEDGGRAGRGRDDLPHPGVQLLGHHRRRAGRAAPGQGEHPVPGRSPTSRTSRRASRSPPADARARPGTRTTARSAK